MIFHAVFISTLWAAAADVDWTSICIHEVVTLCRFPPAYIYATTVSHWTTVSVDVRESVVCRPVWPAGRRSVLINRLIIQTWLWIIYWHWGRNLLRGTDSQRVAWSAWTLLHDGASHDALWCAGVGDGDLSQTYIKVFFINKQLYPDLKTFKHQHFLCFLNTFLLFLAVFFSMYYGAQFLSKYMR